VAELVEGGLHLIQRQQGRAVRRLGDVEVVDHDRRLVEQERLVD
jgi:hypothetical protein